MPIPSPPCPPSFFSPCSTSPPPPSPRSSRSLPRLLARVSSPRSHGGRRTGTPPRPLGPQPARQVRETPGVRASCRDRTEGSRPPLARAPAQASIAPPSLFARVRAPTPPSAPLCSARFFWASRTEETRPSPRTGVRASSEQGRALAAESRTAGRPGPPTPPSRPSSCPQPRTAQQPVSPVPPSHLLCPGARAQASPGSPPDPRGGAGGQPGSKGSPAWSGASPGTLCFSGRRVTVSPGKSLRAWGRCLGTPRVSHPLSAGPHGR